MEIRALPSLKQKNRHAHYVLLFAGVIAVELRDWGIARPSFKFLHGGTAGQAFYRFWG